MVPISSLSCSFLSTQSLIYVPSVWKSNIVNGWKWCGIVVIKYWYRVCVYILQSWKKIQPATIKEVGWMAEFVLLSWLERLGSGSCFHFTTAHYPQCISGFSVNGQESERCWWDQDRRITTMGAKTKCVCVVGGDWVGGGGIEDIWKDKCALWTKLIYSSSPWWWILKYWMVIFCKFPRLYLTIYGNTKKKIMV